MLELVVRKSFKEKAKKPFSIATDYCEHDWLDSSK